MTRRGTALAALTASLSLTLLSAPAGATPIEPARQLPSAVEVLDPAAPDGPAAGRVHGEVTSATVRRFPGGKTAADAGFDTGHLGGVNSAEAWFCGRSANYTSCHQAKVAAEDAVARALTAFAPSTLYLGAGDAYRHCYWNARMTIDMGASRAKGFADRHEAEDSGLSQEMDLRNNSIGRWVGANHRSYASASAECERRAHHGGLWTVADGRLV